MIATISAKMCGKLRMKESVKEIIGLIERYQRIKTPDREKYDHGVHVALLALGDIQDPSAIPFIMSLCDQVRGYEVMALNKFGVTAVSYIIDVLKKSEDKAMLKVAGRVLDSLNDPAAVPVLWKEFTENPVRDAVIRALLRIDPAKMLPRLIAYWTAEPDSALENELVEHILLYKVFDRKYVRFLAAVLKTGKSYDSRQRSAVILGAIGGAEAENALNEALCDEDQLVRMKAAYALKKLTRSTRTAKMIIRSRNCFE
ncbi:MAG: HEAT repeat domain-containing protein [bacterium]